MKSNRVILFGTMGVSLQAFKNLECFYHRSDSFLYLISNKFHFEESKIQIADDQSLKEWKIIEKVKFLSFSQKKLDVLEKKYFKKSSLWRLLINDRRIFFNKYYKYYTNYKVRFSEIEFKKIILTFLLEIESFFDEKSPTEYITFPPTTLLEHLSYYIALEKKISIKVIRHTKIKNYQTVIDNLNEDYSIIKSDFKKKFIEEKYLNQAKKYLKNFQKTKKLEYEGNLIKQEKFKLLKGIKVISRGLLRDFKILFKKKDLHSSGLFLVKEFYNSTNRVYLKNKIKFIFKKRIIKLEEIKIKPFVFFPLHAEPEIALTLYGNNYLNQINLIHEIALDLPSSYILIVKEHPRNIGRRPISFYKDILKLPNIYLSHEKINTNDLIQKSKLVYTISGFITFESILFKKPTITFGKSIYNLLPDYILYKHKRGATFSEEFHYVLENHNYDEHEILVFISSIIKRSIPINKYNSLLQKNKGRETFQIEGKNQSLKNLYKLLN